MPGITRSNDAYGHELWACLTEGRGDEIVERDDGFIAASDWPKRYFEDFNAWAGHEKRYSPGPAGGKTRFSGARPGLCRGDYQDSIDRRLHTSAIDRAYDRLQT